MPGNVVGLYSYTTSNVTVPSNNNTGLYNTAGCVIPTNNNISVSGNITAGGNVNAGNNVNVANNVLAGGEIASNGNITTGGYFIGDGSLLTNINAGNIVNGYGNANVAAYLASGTNTSNIVTTGNVSGTYILGNGSQLTGLPATYSNADVNAHLAAFGSNTISTTGNVTAGYFIGNGSQLTGIVSSYGDANVAAFLPTYTGNLSGSNLNIGNNAQITNDLTVGGTIYGTFSGNISGNLVVPGSNTQVIYNNNGNAGASANFTFNQATNVMSVNGNIAAGTFAGSGSDLTNLPGANVTGQVANALIAGTVYTNAQPNITSLGTLTSLTVSGNIQGGNVSGTGNVTGGNIVIPNGKRVLGDFSAGVAAGRSFFQTTNQSTSATSFISVLPGPNHTGTQGSATGLFAAPDAGNSAIFGMYSFTNEARIQSTFTGTANAQPITFYIAGGGNEVGRIASGGNWGIGNTAPTDRLAVGGNVYVSGNIRPAGILTDGYYYANGTPVSFGGTYGNTNVAAFLAAFGSNTISTTGNVTAGNVIGAYLYGDGSNITGITTNYSNANVAAYLPTYSGNIGNAASDLKLTGNSIILYNVGQPTLSITSPNSTDSYITTPGATRVTLPGANFAGDLVSVEFTYDTTISGKGLNITGNLFGTGNSISTVGNIVTPGIKTDGYYYANGTPVSFGSNYGNSNVANFLANFGSNTVSTTGNVTGGNFVGNGSQLSSITGANVVGAVASATAATTATTATSATTAGTVTTNAQPNITSVGILSSVSVSGNVTTGNILTNGYYYANGTPVSFGSNYGDSNVVSLLSSFGSNTISTTGNVTTSFLLASNIGTQTSPVAVGWINNVAAQSVSTTTLDAGSATITGNISASYFTGNGRLLTGLPTYGNSNVAAFLAAYGSNSILTTGNIQGGNVNGTVVSATGNIECSSNINGVNLNLSGGIYAIGSALTIEDINVDGNIIMNGAAGGGTSGANIDYINGGGYAKFYGNVTTAAGKLIAGTPGSGGVAYANADGTAGQALLTYGNGVTYFGNVGATLSGNLTGDLNGSNIYSLNFMKDLTLTGNISNPAGDFVTIEGILSAGSTSVAGNITGGNILTGGRVSATGNITGNYFFGNGQNLTGVTAALAGNMSGDINGLGTYNLTNIGNISISGAISSVPGDAVTIEGVLTSGAISATGNVTAGNLITTGIVSATSLTANSQIANLLVLNQQIQTTQTPNPAVQSATVADPSRIVVGTGYNGNISPAFDLISIGRQARFLVSDTINFGNTGAFRGIAVQNYANLTANVTNTNARLNGVTGAIAIGGGSSANTYNVTSGLFGGGVGVLGRVEAGGGTSGNLTGLGNTFLSHSAGVFGAHATNAGSNVGNAAGLYAQVTNNGTTGNVLGVAIQVNGTGTFGGNVFGVYMPSTTNSYGLNQTNQARAATNYYFLRNDDDVAQNKMGSMRLFHEFRYTATSSGGALTIDKNNGQVQYVALTENITSITFSNFVRTASDGTNTDQQTDTVTVIFVNDSTGRTVTLPTGSAYKYAGGTNTMGTTPNAYSMLSVTGMSDVAGTGTVYLITVSPEFS